MSDGKQNLDDFHGKGFEFVACWLKGQCLEGLLTDTSTSEGKLLTFLLYYTAIIFLFVNV